MAKENPNASTNTTPSEAESYIGSLLSITSKSEIRYEGVLYSLNPQDRTLGLRNVRSFGTEGRKKDGPQVHPSDKVYEYILFRGGDIKDLQVKTGPTAQVEEQIYNDPAIIQSNYHGGPPSSLRSASAGSGHLPEANLFSEPSASSARSFPGFMPSHSGSQLGPQGSSQPVDNSVSSYGMPTQWQVHSGTPGSIPGAHQHVLSSTSTYSLQNQESTTIAGTNLSNTSNSMYFNATPTLTSEQLLTPFTNSMSSTSSLPFHQTTLINSNGLSLPFPLSYPNASSTEASVDNKLGPGHVSLLPAQSLPYLSPISETTADPLLQQQPPLLTPNHLSQPRLSEHSPEKNSYPNQKNVGVKSSMSPNFSSSTNTPAVNSSLPPLLPLPPPARKLQPSIQFTEEFDFQAMNDKFKKDEVWGQLGKANKKDKVEGEQEYGTSSQDLGGDDSGLISKSDAKSAYNKDDFFDTISVNSIGRGGRNGQNRFSERSKPDSETFGRFQRRSQPSGYNGYGGGRGEYRGPHNWGRDNNYGSRGRGGFRQR